MIAYPPVSSWSGCFEVVLLYKAHSLGLVVIFMQPWVQGLGTFSTFFGLWSEFSNVLCDMWHAG
jgi:hypothetical protein